MMIYHRSRGAANVDTEGRYSNTDFSAPTTGNKFFAKKQNITEEIPNRGYEEVDDQNVIPLQLKSQPKNSPKKTTTAKNMGPTHHMPPSATNPVVVRHPLKSASAWLKPRPPSPDKVYYEIAT